MARKARSRAERAGSGMSPRKSSIFGFLPALSSASKRSQIVAISEYGSEGLPGFAGSDMRLPSCRDRMATRSNHHNRFPRWGARMGNRESREKPHGGLASRTGW